MSLIYNGTTITTWANMSSYAASRPAVKDIAWPNSTGNDALWTGDSAGGGVRLTFSEQGDFRNRLRAVSEAALLSAREVLAVWARIPIFATLTYNGQSFARMRLEQVDFGDAELVITPTEWQMVFSATWKQYPL